MKTKFFIFFGIGLLSLAVSCRNNYATPSELKRAGITIDSILVEFGVRKVIMDSLKLDLESCYFAHFSMCKSIKKNFLHSEFKVILETEISMCEDGLKTLDIEINSAVKKRMQFGKRNSMTRAAFGVLDPWYIGDFHIEYSPGGTMMFAPNPVLTDEKVSTHQIRRITPD